MSEGGTVDTNLQAKYQALRGLVASYGAAAVCFSGGVDSTLLLAVAHDVLGARVIAITESNELYPQRETAEAEAFCAGCGIEQVLLQHTFGSIEGIAENPRNRCYLCKKQLFARLQEAADEKAVELGLIAAGEHIVLLEGSNVSDLSDYRPGHQAVEEHGAKSPLEAAGLTKEDIREISRELGLSTWDKPSFACLASRFPYGQHITAALLERVGAAEQLLLDAGFAQVRVRMHENGTLARIELEPQRMAEGFAFLQAGGAQQLRELGFTHVSLDMLGYRTGSMNG